MDNEKQSERVQRILLYLQNVGHPVPLPLIRKNTQLPKSQLKVLMSMLVKTGIVETVDLGGLLTYRLTVLDQASSSSVGPEEGPGKNQASPSKSKSNHRHRKHILESRSGRR